MPGPTQLQVTRDRGSDGAYTLALAGELDIATAPQLESEVTALADAGAGTVVIDLGDLGFIDSTGLRLFFALNERAGADGWVLRLRRPSRQVSKLLEVTGTGDELPIVDVDGADPS